MKRRKLTVSEVVRIIDLSPISMGDQGDDLRFRIEVLRDGSAPNRFFARVLRLEHYRVQPSFPQRRRRPISQVADEQIFVVDDQLSSSTHSRTATAALARALRTIEERFL